MDVLIPKDSVTILSTCYYVDRKRSAKKSSTPVLANSSALASLPSQSMSQPASMSQSQCEETVIGIYFCGDPIPYRHTIPGTDITLGQFKQLISKKGNYR